MQSILFLSSGISQWPRQVPSGPPAHPPVWGARRPELVQPAGATVALHEHSEVLSLLDRNLETSMRFHFHRMMLILSISTRW